MNVYYPLFEHQIIVEENKGFCVVVENKKAFVTLIEDILYQMNGNDGEFIICDNKHKKIDLYKHAELIGDFFSIDLNSKKILTKIYNDLTTLSVNEENLLQTRKMISDLNRYLEDIILNYDISLSLNKDIDMTNLFKVSNIKVNIEENSFIENLISYIELICSVFNKYIFIMVNLKTFVDDTEIISLYEWARNKEIKLILLESKFQKNLNEEIPIVIDKDLCRII